MTAPLGDAELVELYVRRELARLELAALPKDVPTAARIAAEANLATAEANVAAQDRKPDGDLLVRRTAAVLAEVAAAIDVQLQAFDSGRELLAAHKSLVDEQLLDAQTRVQAADQARQVEQSAEVSEVSKEEA